MVSIDRIVVAKDFSDCSEQALEAGLRLASRFGAEVHVLYVQVLHDDPFSPSVFPRDHEARVDEELKRVVARRADELSGPMPRIVHGHERDVAAAPAILRYASDVQADLIVMGTHGRRGLRHLVLGSVAEEVVRTSPCPVLTVHGAERADLPGPDSEVLLPLDFSRNALGAVGPAREIARAFDASLRVVHVIQETMHPAFYNAGAFSVYDLQPDIEVKARTHLERALRDAAGPDVPMTFGISIGHAASEIVREAAERNVGLIVMATHGLTGLAHLFLGSVAERVVRLATCPVLTVKPVQTGNSETARDELVSTA